MRRQESGARSQKGHLFGGLERILLPRIASILTSAFCLLTPAFGCDIPWTIRIEAPDRCATWERLRHAFSVQEGLRWWQRWTLDQPTEPARIEDLGLLTVVERDEPFPCLPGSQDICAGIWIFWFGHHIEYARNWNNGLALDHEIGHALWEALEKRGRNVGHGTLDDPFYIGTRAWLKFFYYLLPEGHSYWPQFGPSAAPAGFPAEPRQAGMPAPPGCEYRVNLERTQ